MRTEAGHVNRQMDAFRRLAAVAGSFLTQAGAYLRGYIPALIAVATALSIHATWAVVYDPKRGAAVTFIYLVAFLVAAWCGYIPGLLATVVIGYGAAFLSKGTLSWQSVSPSGLGIYLALSLVVSAQAASRRRVEEVLHTMNTRLDSRIREQTAELLEANTRLRDRLAELETLYGKLSVGLCFLDESLQVLRVNEKFAELSRLPVESHLDRELHDVLGEPLADTLERLCRRVLVTEEPVLDYEVSAPAALAGGAKYWAVSCSPVASASGVLGLQLVVQDVTERRQAEQELNAANRELRRANQDLEQFAHSASHDLQEPIRTVAIYSQMLQRFYSAKLGAEGDLFVQYTLAAALRLQTLVRDLRVYTHTSSETIRLDERADANDAVSEALADLRPATEKARASVVCERLPVVRMQPTQLARLFQNLISNAVKYRSEMPAIHIGAERNEAGEWVFAVRDNGIGIDPQYHEQVFGLFKRLHPADRYPGTGIGLALCKRIVERNGGRIWVESQLGAGATFFFTLPVI